MAGFHLFLNMYSFTGISVPALENRYSLVQWGQSGQVDTDSSKVSSSHTVGVMDLDRNGKERTEDVSKGTDDHSSNPDLQKIHIPQTTFRREHSSTNLKQEHLDQSSTNLPSSETHNVLPGGASILKRGMACTFCRRRKLRCSGDRPKCANCTRHNQPCEYVTRRENGEYETEQSDPIFISPFTAAPLPHFALRDPPPLDMRRSWRRASMQRPFDHTEWSRRDSVLRNDTWVPGRGIDDLWDTRPGFPRHNSGPISTESPMATHVQLQPFENGTPTRPGPGTGGWDQVPGHEAGTVPLTSPPTTLPPTQSLSTPPIAIPIHYEHVAPVPPPIQYPAEEETAWYQAALDATPRQPFEETFNHALPPPPPPPPPQADNQYDPNHQSQIGHYPLFEGYQDLEFGSTNTNPGPGPQGQTPAHGAGQGTGEISLGSSAPSSSIMYPPHPQHGYHGHGPGSMNMPNHGHASPGQYGHTYHHLPSPYASQATLPFTSPPLTIPIYQHRPYTTPAIDGLRPGLVHEGMYPSGPHGSGGSYGPTQSYGDTYHIDPTSGPPHYHQTQSNSINSFPQPDMQPHPRSGPYTFPAISIPLPESETNYFDRPTLPRAVSSPTTLTPEDNTPPQSDGSISQATTTTTVNVSVPEGVYYPQNMNVMYPDDSGSSKVDQLSERLGEFFLGPENKTPGDHERVRQYDDGGGGERHTKKSRKDVSGGVGISYSPSHETDGLTETTRNALLDTFFEHHKMFIDLSVPRFKSRLTFHDRRRPSLALLNAMYMWATRMTHAPNMQTMETHFFQQAIVHLDASAATGDRLMDCIRAAFLLSAFQYMNGRHHSGYLLCGHSAQLVKSCGLHRIASTVFSPAPPTNPFLRNRPYLLPPPEDALELGERIHTFWAVFSLDRSSSALTGFTSSFRDSDITTPWPRELSDIASGNVTTRDDVTVRDLYRVAYQHPNERSYLRWIKAVTILERASKLVLLDPSGHSEHTRQWASCHHNPSSPPPGGYLESPRYRVPIEFEEVKFALEGLLAASGDDGVFPVDQKRLASRDGKEEVDISPAVILFHHVVAAIETLLYDTNSLDAENTEALIGARKAVSLIKELPPLPVHAVDAFAPLTWVMVAKVLIKEMYRLKKLGDARYKGVEEEVQCLIDEINRMGTMMPPSKMYAKGVEELMKYGNTQADDNVNSFANTNTNTMTNTMNNMNMNTTTTTNNMTTNTGMMTDANMGHLYTTQQPAGRVWKNHTQASYPKTST